MNEVIIIEDPVENIFLLNEEENVSLLPESVLPDHTRMRKYNDDLSIQHIDATTNKETLVEADKVAIYDSITGKIVLTDKSNVGYRITDIISTTSVWSSSKTNEEIKNLLPLIYAGL